MVRIGLISLILVSTLGFSETKTIKVGGYFFSPFVEIDKSGKTSGLTIDFIETLNKSQKRFHFKFVQTTPVGRYKDFADGKFDVIFFESKTWGWQNKNIFSSKVFLKGGEVYIAKAAPGRDQTYFDSFSGKSLMGIEGYHYKVVNFVTDPKILASKHNMKVTDDPWGLIRSVLKNEVDIAIVTKSYLMRTFLTNKMVKSKLLISIKLDQEYNHTILGRAGGPIGKQEIDQLLDRLQEKGVTKHLWWQYGIGY